MVETCESELRWDERLWCDHLVGSPSFTGHDLFCTPRYDYVAILFVMKNYQFSVYSYNSFTVPMHLPSYHRSSADIGEENDESLPYIRMHPIDPTGAKV